MTSQSALAGVDDNDDICFLPEGCDDDNDDICFLPEGCDDNSNHDGDVRGGAAAQQHLMME